MSSIIYGEQTLAARPFVRLLRMFSLRAFHPSLFSAAYRTLTVFVFSRSPWN